MEKEEYDRYIIFYFDIDTTGDWMDLCTVRKFFDSMATVAAPNEKLIMLPKFFSHTPWMTKEEYIELLENKLKEVKGENNE